MSLILESRNKDSYPMELYDRISGIYKELPQTTEEVLLGKTEYTHWQSQLDLIQGAVDCESVAIQTISGDSLLTFVTSKNEENFYADGQRHPLGSGYLCETVMVRNEILMVRNTSKGVMWSGCPEIMGGTHSYYGVPLHWPDGKVFGTLNIQTKSSLEDPHMCRKLLVSARKNIEADLCGIVKSKTTPVYSSLPLQNRKSKTDFSLGLGLELQMRPLIMQDLENNSQQINFSVVNLSTDTVVLHHSHNADNSIGESLEYVRDSFTDPNYSSRDLKTYTDFLSHSNLSYLAMIEGVQSKELEGYNNGHRYHIQIVARGFVDKNTGVAYAILYVMDKTVADNNYKMLFDIIAQENYFAVRLTKRRNRVRLFMQQNEKLAYPGGFNDLSVAEFDHFIEAQPETKELYRKLGISSIAELAQIITDDKTHSLTYTISDVQTSRRAFYAAQYFLNTKDDNAAYLIVKDITDTVFGEEKIREQIESDFLYASAHTKAKTDFLGRVSHDLRTPMNAILGLASLGEEAAHDTRVQSYFKIIDTSARKMMNLLDELLDMQTVTLGWHHRDIEIHNAYRIAEEALYELEAKASEKNISLILDSGDKTELFLKVDESAFRRTIKSLVDNAIKYSHPNSEVICKYHLNESGLSVYEVTDTGVGMSSEFIEHMYNPFTVEHDSLTNTVQGSGVGLALVKNLVDYANGTIECHSQLGIGTTFKLTIPTPVPTAYEIAEHLNKPEPKSNISQLVGKKALIVEDNFINLSITRNILESFGLEVDTAENGQLGVEMCQAHGYDIIFMDIRMPVKDGLTAARDIRKFNTYTPIIGLSANAHEKDVKKSLNAGMNDHLAKPIDRFALIKTALRMTAQ